MLGIFVGSDGYLKSRTHVFVTDGSESIVEDIVGHLESGKNVLVDTSRLTDQAELIIGSIIANELLENYKGYRTTEEPGGKLVVSIVI